MLIRNPNFLFLWFSQILSGVGEVLFTVGVMVSIFQATGSALQTVTVLIAGTLPIFVFGSFAGALVDRFSRRAILFWMNVVRALLLIVLLFFLSRPGISPWTFYLIAAGLATAGAFYIPARQAIVPSLVPAQVLVRANGLIIGTNQIAQAAGYGLGGWLTLQLSLTAFIRIDIVVFLFAAALVSLLRPSGPARPAAEHNEEILWRSVRQGIRYLRGHPVARPLVVMEILEHVPHGIWTSAMMLVFVTQALGGEAVDWGYQNAGFYSGMIFGAAIAAGAAGVLSRWPGWVIIVNAFINSVLTLLYALSPSLGFALAVSFAFGPTFALRDIAQDALLQTSVEHHILGRIFALRHVGWNITFMLSGFLFAFLADWLSARTIYVIGAGLYLLTSLYALSSRALRHSRIESANQESRIRESVDREIAAPL